MPSEKPLLVSGPLVHPIRDGLKTETRRLTGLDQVNIYPHLWNFIGMDYYDESQTWCARFMLGENSGATSILCPYGGTGTTLWVRENWFVPKSWDKLKPSMMPSYDASIVGYMADGDKQKWAFAGRTRPSIHMPRWLSRYDLLNLETYPERLQDITEESAKAEGVRPGIFKVKKTGFELETIQSKCGWLGSYIDGFKYTWFTLNGSESWDRNHWVWRIKFNLKPKT
jgi:hypothetical protein